MDNLSEHIERLKEHLIQLFEQMKPYAEGSIKREKEEQLKAIEKSIGTIKQKELEIPHELRSLKLNLLADLDKINDSKSKFDELVSCLNELLVDNVPRKQKKKHKPNNPISFESETDKSIETVAVDHQQNKIHEDSSQLSFINLKGASFEGYFLSQLIQNRVIKTNTVIRRRFNDNNYEGVITSDGKVKITKGEKILSFDTIHAAAKFINPDCSDGLIFWRIQHPKFGNLISLSTYLKSNFE